MVGPHAVATEVTMKGGLFFMPRLTNRPMPKQSSKPQKPDDRDLVSKALAMLSRRDMSRSEFIGKLVSGEYSKDEAEAVADWCASEGFLDETRFAESNARRLGLKYGAKRVGAALKQKGVREDVIDASVASLKMTDLCRAQALWQRKFHEPATDSSERSRQIRYLQSRGFGFDVIKKVITGVIEDE
jgi:regulatory protein